MLTTKDAPAPAAQAGTIRPFVASDSGTVADLLVRAFRGLNEPAPLGMAAYLREVYLDAPWYDPAMASRVVALPDGRIAGFIGVSALPMRLGERRIRAAVISSLAVDPRIGDPMIGPRLLRDVRSGPQDAILNDRSNGVAVSLLRTLGAQVIRDYSLDWIRVLRPAGLALESLATRFHPARWLTSLGRPIDSMVLRRAAEAEEPSWLAPTPSRAADAFSDRDVGIDELVATIPSFLAVHPLRPDWSAAELRTLLNDGAQKSEYGPLTARLVIAPNGKPAGLFLYHLRPRRTAHILQLLAAKGREGIVIDRAIAHATSAGAVAIRGRAQPWLLDALIERRAVLVPDMATIVYSRDAEVLNAFHEGTAFFTGLAGENWMRLNNDSF